MALVNPKRYHSQVREAWQAPFKGWNFYWLDKHMTQEAPPWDYAALVKEHFHKSHSLLDMGTGGGEFLASLVPLPPNTHATEAYPPNQPIAKDRLSPLGVTVHPVEEDGPLPFSEAQFDLVINRHESYHPAEVCRVLKPRGLFITQQVGELDNLELNLFLEEVFPGGLSNWGLESEVLRLAESGFAVSRAEKAALRTQFQNIAAVVYYLKAISWQIEGFNPDTYRDRLIALHNFIEMNGPLITTSQRFLITAQKKE